MKQRALFLNQFEYTLKKFINGFGAFVSMKFRSCFLALFIGVFILAMPSLASAEQVCLDPIRGCYTLDEGQVAPSCDDDLVDGLMDELEQCEDVCVLVSGDNYEKRHKIQTGNEPEQNVRDMPPSGECDDLADSTDSDYDITLTFSYSDGLRAQGLEVSLEDEAASETTSSSGEVTFSFNSDTKFPVTAIWDEGDLALAESVDSCITSFEFNNDSNSYLVDLGCSSQASSDEDVPDLPPPVDGDERICNNVDGIYENVPCSPGSPPTFYGAQSSCSDAGFLGGELSCDNNCNIVTDQCFDCPSASDASEGACAESANPNICEECATCAQTSYCENYCTEDFEFSGLSASRVADEIAIELSWNMPNSCIVSDLDIYRCVAGDEQACDDFSFYAAGGTSSERFKDSNIQSGERYCYRVDLSTQSAPGEIETQSADICIEAPSEECLAYGADPLCHEGDIVQCTDGVLENIESCPYRCLYTEEYGEPFCSEAPSQCDMGAGPFGSFGYLYESFLAEAVNGCYYDYFSYEFSNVGSLDDCGEVTSCYDYFASSSCESNDCNVPMDCEWNDYIDEFSLGACMPSDNQYIDCNECDNTPLGSCNQDLCEGFYGNNSAGESLCFYNSDPEEVTNNANVANLNMCSNVDEVACETYNTQMECEGEAVKGANGFLVNAPLLSNLGGNSLNSVDNSVERLSNDVLGLNKCVWESSNSRCVRDASSQRFEHGVGSRDCRNSDLGCLTDFESPSTVFMLNNETRLVDGMSVSKGMLRSGFFNVSDNYYGSEDINTYFVIDVDQSSYPDNEALNKKLSTETTSSLSSPNYYLNFFSLDSANNIEEVQSVSFSVVDSLELNVELIEDSYFKESDNRFYTNLSGVVRSGSVDLTLEQCDVELRSLDIDDVSRFKSSTDFEFSETPDGNYKLLVNCVDDYSQTSSEEKYIQLLGDDLIVPQTPLFTTLPAGKVDLELTTGEDAQQCQIRRRFSASEKLDWMSMEEIQPNTFSTSLSISTSTIARYETRCKFDSTEFDQSRLDEDDWFYGELPQSFIFAVDADAPDIKVLDSTTGEDYNITEEDSEVDLVFVCDWSKEDDRWEYYGFGAGCNVLDVCSYDKERQRNDCDFDIGDRLAVDEAASSHGKTIFVSKGFSLDNDRLDVYQDWYVDARAVNEFGEEVNISKRLGLVDYNLPGQPIVIIS